MKVSCFILSRLSFLDYNHTQLVELNRTDSINHPLMIKKNGVYG